MIGLFWCWLPQNRALAPERNIFFIIFIQRNSYFTLFTICLQVPYQIQQVAHILRNG
ncbi:hypothetical protein MIZ03_1518 [Rhodoferax lithotrophicus]|uniref:Uncharacterized protein n=1 Tax=Rhodoferax lithotrophicus TaxID=2798804 RepID=A0ABN6D3T0_9BURK|nr:hypothetical protein MIZ03_1518 [Rhodoferax sp. MIZ03]